MKLNPEKLFANLFRPARGAFAAQNAPGKPHQELEAFMTPFLCSHRKAVFLYEHSGLRYYRCAACGCVFYETALAATRA